MSTIRRPVLMALVLVLAVGLSGCTADTGDDGDGEDVGDQGSPSPTPTDETDGGAGTGGPGTSADEPANGTLEVSMQDIDFEPPEVWVEPGTTVRWTNDGVLIHTATADDDGWDTGDVAAGASAEQVFDESGEHTYHCVYHQAQGMTGTVHVV